MTVKENISLSFQIDGKHIWFAQVSREPKIGDTFMLPDGRKVEVIEIADHTEKTRWFDLECKVIPRGIAPDKPGE